MPQASDANNTRSGLRPCREKPKALVLLADEAPCLDRQAVVGDLARRDRVPPDLGDRPDLDVVGIEVGEEEAEPAEAALWRAGASEEEHHL